MKRFKYCNIKHINESSSHVQYIYNDQYNLIVTRADINTKVLIVLNKENMVVLSNNRPTKIWNYAYTTLVYD